MELYLEKKTYDNECGVQSKRTNNNNNKKLYMHK